MSASSSAGCGRDKDNNRLTKIVSIDEDCCSFCEAVAWVRTPPRLRRSLRRCLRLWRKGNFGIPGDEKDRLKSAQPEVHDEKCTAGTKSAQPQVYDLLRAFHRDGVCINFFFRTVWSVATDNRFMYSKLRSGRGRGRGTEVPSGRGRLLALREEGPFRFGLDRHDKSELCGDQIVSCSRVLQGLLVTCANVLHVFSSSKNVLQGWLPCAWLPCGFWLRLELCYC